jgi:uncharacterized protein
MFQYIADYITYNLLGLSADERFSVVLNFFIHDVLKILILIFFVVSFVAFVRTFFNQDKLRKFMEKTRFGIGNLIASMFGAVTPFCSCSSIPLFLGFLKGRIPLGVSFSFLITSPLVNEVAFVIMGGLFGWKMAFIYAGAGIFLGVFGGMLLGAMKLEKSLILEEVKGNGKKEILPKRFVDKLSYAFVEGKKTFKQLVPYVLAGVALGALIHGYVPQDFFVNYVGKYNLFAVPMAVLLGVPVYAGCSTVAPIIFSITQNGIPLGTSLAFMMAIAGLSLPEALILKRVMKMKLLLIFFGMVTLGIILIGYGFNLLSYS